MTAYQPEQWHDMFVAMAGAAAARDPSLTRAAGYALLAVAV